MILLKVTFSYFLKFYLTMPWGGKSKESNTQRTLWPLSVVIVPSLLGLYFLRLLKRFRCKSGGGL